MSIGLTTPQRWALSGSMAAASLVPLNSTMITVGLPDIARDFDRARGTAALLVTSYLIAMAALQPFAGRLGDRVGNRLAVVVGLGGFTVASAAATLVPSFPALLAARVAQATFAAALIPNVQAIVYNTVPEEARGTAFGYLSSGLSAGAAVGPILGGGLIELWGWRGIFVANTPVALAAMALLWSFAPERGERRDRRSSGRGGMRRRAFVAACVTQGMSNLAIYSVVLIIPVILDHEGWSGGEVGLALSTLTFGMLALNPAGGALSDRRGRSFPVVTGMICLLAGTAVLTMGASSSNVALIAGMAIVGVGMGFSTAPLQTAALESVSPAVAGAAAGVLSTSRYLGSITGSLAIAALVGDSTDGARTVLALSAVAAIVATASATQITALQHGREDARTGVG